MNGMDVKLARVQLGLSQWELARRAGTSAPRVSEMETGKRDVPPNLIMVLQRALAEAEVGVSR